MGMCDTDCENLIRCESCGRQLCKVAPQPSEAAIEKRCINEGYYRIGENSLCMECQSPQVPRPTPSIIKTRSQN